MKLVKLVQVSFLGSVLGNSYTVRIRMRQTLLVAVHPPRYIPIARPRSTNGAREFGDRARRLEWGGLQDHLHVELVWREKRHSAGCKTCQGSALLRNLVSILVFTRLGAVQG